MTKNRTLSLKTWLIIDLAILTALQGILELIEGPTWLRLAAIGLTCGIAVAQAVNDYWQTREAANREAEISRRLKNQEYTAQIASTVTTTWPPPLVNSIDPYGSSIRVRPWLYGPNPNALPEYIPRDMDIELEKQLSKTGRVMIVATPLSGASRTSYELIKRTRSGSQFISPRPPDGLKRALELDIVGNLEKSSTKLVWLHDLEKFSAEGLTTNMLETLAISSPGLRIIAILRSGQTYTEWVSDHQEMASYFGPPIVIGRALSDAEILRANELNPGEDFSSGVAAPFTFISSLLNSIIAGNRFCNRASCAGDCSMSRAVVDIALNWSACQSMRPLYKTTLTAILAGRAIQQSGIDQDHLQFALQWASQEILEGKSLITLTATQSALIEVAPQAQLAELWTETNVPSVDVWTAALEDAVMAADYDALGRMAYQAEIRNWIHLASLTWDRLPYENALGAAWARKAANFCHDIIHDGPRQVALEQRVCRYQELEAPSTSTHSASLLRLGDAFMHDARPKEALEVLLKSIELAELNSESATLCSALSKAAEANFRLLNFEESSVLYVRAHQSLLAQPQQDPAKHAMLDAESAKPLIRLGQARDAIPILERALEIMEKARGKNSIAVAYVCGNLGMGWRELAQYSKSAQYHHRSLRIVEEERGPQHTMTADALMAYGLDLSNLGRLDEARDSLKRALAINKKARGEDSPDTAIAKLNLAPTLASLGKVDEAIRLLGEARAVLELNFGPTSDPLILIYNSMANCKRRVGRLAESVADGTRALEIARITGGSLNRAMCLSNLALSMIASGERNEARLLFEEALAIVSVEFTEDSSITRFVVENYRLCFPKSIVGADGTVLYAVEDS